MGRCAAGVFCARAVGYHGRRKRGGKRAGAKDEGVLKPSNLDSVCLDRTRADICHKHTTAQMADPSVEFALHVVMRRPALPLPLPEASVDAHMTRRERMVAYREDFAALRMHHFWQAARLQSEMNGGRRIVEQLNLYDECSLVQGTVGELMCYFSGTGYVRVPP